MPLRRRAPRRPRVRRRRVVKRRVRKSRVPRYVPQKVHVFRRVADLNSGNFTTNTGGGNGQAYSITADGHTLNTGAGGVSNLTYYSWSLFFTLDMLPNYTEYIAMFDQYKIINVELTFRSFQNCSVATGVANEVLSVMAYSVLDHDDVVLATASNVGLQAFRQRPSFREQNFLSNRPLRRRITPRIAIAEYGSGVFASYGNFKAGWIDMNSPAVQHYGVKGMFEVFSPASATTNYIWFRPELTITLACRDEQ